MKIVLTGSSSGIGRHLAARLCAQQHEVWGLARSRQASFEAEAAAKGFSFHALACDVAKGESVSRCRQEIGQTVPGLDALICCAGAQPPVGPAMTLDPEAWLANVQLNLGGTFLAIRAFHDLLTRATRRAKIVCFSGGGATGPRVNFSAYAVAKAGVVRLTETLAHEWAGQPMDINAIAPGAINTKMTEEVVALGPGVVGEKEYAQAVQQLRGGGASVEKVAGLVDFLLSPASDGVSGRLLSAPWDPWQNLGQHQAELAGTDIYTLRRIVPADRGRHWD